MGSMGMGAQTATVSPLAKYKLVFLGDQSVGKLEGKEPHTFFSDHNF